MTDLEPGDIEVLVEVVKNRQKFPRSCVRAFNGLGSAPNDDTERIFYDHGGLAAWAACILTRTAADSHGHASGKTKRQRLLNRIDAMPPDSRRRLAIQLAAAIEPERARVEQLVNTARQQPDRSRRSKSSARQASDGGSEMDLEGADDETQDSQTEPGTSVRNAPDSGQVFRNANTAECARLFPRYMNSSIRRMTDASDAHTFYAAITMSCRTDSSEWEMKLDVMANKIEYIARELFGAHIETESGSRHVYLAGSTAAVPHPSLLLKGCRTEAVQNLFGSEVADAVFATGTHRLEMDEGRECTNCVTMLIRQKSSDSADIHLLLPVDRAISLRDQLYGIRSADG